MSLTDPDAPDAVTLAARYRDGSLTPEQAVEAALARMAEVEPALNAVACDMADAARSEAAMRGAELRAGTDRGPLHGVPVAIKDLIDVAGSPVGYGTRAHPPRIADVDAALVANLRAAGAVILSKTNLLEYAYGVAHPQVGQTNNPHDPARTAGGSSGGSAALVAAGVLPLAVGTDTGGSIRIPAAYCGIVGLKPSFGLVPLDGVFPLAQSLDHAGPLTRTVTDAALLLAAMSGQAMPLRDLAAGDLRIGVLRAQFPAEAQNAPVGALVEDVLAGLAARGAQLWEVTIPALEEATARLMTILMPEASVIHRELLPMNPEGYAPGTRRQIEDGFAIPATTYLMAKAFQAQLADRVEAAFDGVDVLVSPAVPFVAPFEDPEIADGADSELLASAFSNVTGHPSVSIPCGTVDGLPVGLQLTGRRGHDAALLSAARRIEAILAGT